MKLYSIFAAGIIMAVASAAAQTGTKAILVDTKTHQVNKPAASASTPWDLDFTGLAVNGLSTSSVLQTISAKNVAILTAGAPADIRTITVPSSITRHRCLGGLNTSALSVMVTESQSGNPAAATFALYTSAAGGGSQALATVACSNGVLTFAPWPATAPGGVTTTQTLYIRQLTNSGFAANISFYVVIQPVP